MRQNVTQAGTGTVYRYVDNSASKNMVVIVQDNAPDEADNGRWVTSVTIGDAAASRDPTIDNRWTKSITLSEGYNSAVIVTATDRAGNSASDNVENIFIDAQAPTIDFNTITRTTGAVEWTSGILINDNTPEIKLTVLDPGYPTTGLGVAYENLIVILDNDPLAAANPDNFFAIYSAGTYIAKLENKGPWATQADIAAGIFENLYDNAGKGLVDGTYYIHVWASDNLFHGADNGKVESRSFTIDTIKPGKENIVFEVTTYQTTTTLEDPHIQKSTSLWLSGTIPAGEIGGVIKVYVDGVVAGTVTTTITSWRTSITLTPGATQKVEVSFTDLAGNESDKKLYGYFMADGTPPRVTITAPVSGSSTDVASVPVSGKLEIDTWETIDDFKGNRVTIQVGSAAPGYVTNIDDQGNFTTSATLAEGTNIITVMATDEAGNVGSTSVTVTRTVTPWSTYAIIIVIVALILAAIAIFRKK